MESAILNIRTDKNIKIKAEKIFDELGLNMSTAINIFLRQTIRENGKQRYRSVIRIGNDSVERFWTVAEGAASVNGTPSAIVRCCKHNKPTYKGYRWKYAD